MGEAGEANHGFCLTHYNPVKLVETKLELISILFVTSVLLQGNDVIVVK